jgi:hypothetical protein
LLSTRADFSGNNESAVPHQRVAIPVSPDLRCFSPKCATPFILQWVGLKSVSMVFFWPFHLGVTPIRQTFFHMILANRSELIDDIL